MEMAVGDQIDIGAIGLRAGEGVIEDTGGGRHPTHRPVAETDDLIAAGNQPGDRRAVARYGGVAGPGRALRAGVEAGFADMQGHEWLVQVQAGSGKPLAGFIGDILVQPQQAGTAVP